MSGLDLSKTIGEQSGNAKNHLGAVTVFFKNNLSYTQSKSNNCTFDSMKTCRTLINKF